MSRILVIDDNELVGKMLREVLTEQSYTVKVAMDANQGYADAIDFQPDLMLIDVQLPDVVGFDLIRIIKNREDLQHIPIIMITGTAHKTEEKVKGFQMGADDYVLKPFEMPELLERIKAVLRRSAMSKTPSPVRRMGEGWDESKGVPAPLPSPGLKPGEEDFKQPLSLKETLYKTLISPDALSEAMFPPVAMPYLAALLGLSLGGWAISAGSTVKPVLIGLGTVGFWGLCVSILVMACSIMGISLSWREGARLLSLAGLPLLLKLSGAFVMTLVTSLAPFYFTAGPSLVLNSTSVLWQRLDIYELWMVWLITVMVRQCHGSSKQKAWMAAVLVWPILAYWQSLWKH